MLPLVRQVGKGWCRGQLYPGGCIPGLGRGRAAVVCCVSELRGWGCCGVEAHGCGSCAVALGREVLAGVVLFPRPAMWYFSIGWCGVVLTLVCPSLRLVVLCCSAGVVSWCLGVSVVLVAGPGVVWLWLCCCVGCHDVAGCGLSVGVVVASGEVVGGVEGTPRGSPPLGFPLLLSGPLLPSYMPHIP
jgi:hypothetical protein